MLCLPAAHVDTTWAHGMVGAHMRRFRKRHQGEQQ